MFDTLTKKRRTIDIDINSNLGDIDDLLLDLSKEYFETQKTYDEELKNRKVASIQAEIDALEKRNETEQEEEERQKRLLDLQKQREKVANIAGEKNVKIYQNGEWTWIANPKELAQEQQTLADMEQEFADWENENSIKHTKERLEEQIKLEEDTFTNHYKDMESLTTDFLNDLTLQYGTQWDKIIEIIAGKLTEVKSMYGDLMGTTPLNLSSSSSIYGNSIDLENAQSVLGSRYKYVNTEGMAQELIQSLLKNGDLVVGGTGATGGVGDIDLNGATRVAGSNREETLELLKKLILGYSDGGLVPYTGLAAVHGTPSNPESYLSAESTKNFLNAAQILQPIAQQLLMNFKTPSIPTFQPSMATAGNSPINHNYYISVGEVRTNDASGFITNLKNMALKK
jgi:hypothetical protein